MKPYFERGGITIYHGDCLDVLPKLSPAALILTDPPYNVSARAVGGRANTTIGRVMNGVRRDGSESYREIVRDFGDWDHDWDAGPFLGEVPRLLIDGGSLVAFTSEFLFAPYLLSGLNHRALMFWRKSNPAPNFRKQIVRALEMAVWQTKGGSWTFNAGGYRPNVWDGPIINGYTVQNTDEKRVHPTQKPEWLMREWVALFSNPDDLILDPFMGSGTTLKAAHDLGRRAIGIEISEEYCHLAATRLSQQVMPLWDTSEGVGARVPASALEADTDPLVGFEAEAGKSRRGGRDAAPVTVGLRLIPSSSGESTRRLAWRLPEGE